MFGYATDETEECMPLTILLAHKLNAKLKELSRNGVCPWIRPDSKSQVSDMARFLCRAEHHELAQAVCILLHFDSSIVIHKRLVWDKSFK